LTPSQDRPQDRPQELHQEHPLGHLAVTLTATIPVVIVPTVLKTPPLIFFRMFKDSTITFLDCLEQNCSPLY
jgi:hypothetical protein